MYIARTDVAPERDWGMEQQISTWMTSRCLKWPILKQSFWYLSSPTLFYPQMFSILVNANFGLYCSQNLRITWSFLLLLDKWSVNKFCWFTLQNTSGIQPLPITFTNKILVRLPSLLIQIMAVASSLVSLLPHLFSYYLFTTQHTQYIFQNEGQDMSLLCLKPSTGSHFKNPN